MRLQTRSPHMRNKTIKVNGNIYTVDKYLCLEVENEEDVDKLMRTGWTDDLVLPESPRPKPAAPAPALG